MWKEIKPNKMTEFFRPGLKKVKILYLKEQES